MTKKTGRPNTWEEVILPRWEDIRKMAEDGYTDRDIANALGIGFSTLTSHKTRHADFSEMIKKAHRKPVDSIKKALFKRATGYRYSEKKVIVEKTKLNDFLKSVLEEAGIDVAEIELPQMIRTEVTVKEMPPDVAAGIALLKHWDRENGWTNDPAVLDLKKKELKLKEKQIEKGEW